MSSTLETPAGVVFDMDGLLLDSERLARDTFVAACQAFDWEPDLAVYDLCVGSTYEATERLLKDNYGPQFPYEEVSEHWASLYHDHVLHRPVEVKRGAKALLARLSLLDVPCALATSTRRATAEAKLKHAGLDVFFVDIVCGGETPRGKPHPDPYLRAVQRIRREPEVCWAFEDSDNGTLAAHSAGLKVFQVPDQVAPGQSVREIGHPILQHLGEVLELLVEP